MSRIGKLPIPIPAGVKVQIQGRRVQVEGPKGKLAYEHNAQVAVAQEPGRLLVSRDDAQAGASAQQGLARTLINNMVVGVTKGYVRELDIIGVGFRAEVKGPTLFVTVGFTQPAEIAVPPGIEVRVDKNTHLVVTGIDKRLVGQFAANVRRLRPPEPYKGKGIKYTEEKVRRKEGKTSA
jgi:large subunit ribosomal protein L6